MSKQKLQKFLVVSYDDDQQQWFWDFVAARTEQEAVTLVCKRRPYVIADNLKTRRLSRIVHQFEWDTAIQSVEAKSKEKPCS